MYRAFVSDDHVIKLEYVWSKLFKKGYGESKPSSCELADVDVHRDLKLEADKSSQSVVWHCISFHYFIVAWTW